MKVYPGLANLYGNVLTAIDFETTGLVPGWNEIIQVAAVPLDAELNPHPEIPPFYTNVAPKYPERLAPATSGVHGLSIDQLILHAPSQETVADLFYDWFQKIDLPLNKRLVPLAHNWSFESGHMTHWLGHEMKSQMFHHAARDSMLLAVAINDRAMMLGNKPPFSAISLPSLCKQLKVQNDNPHDAYCDAVAAARMYRRLIEMDWLDNAVI